MSSVRRLVRPTLLIVLVIAALPATLGPGSGRPVAQVGRPTPKATPGPSTSATPPTPTPDPKPAPLTLDMAVGQMMAASFGGPTITEGLRRLILDEKVGTVLIFSVLFSLLEPVLQPLVGRTFKQ